MAHRPPADVILADLVDLDGGHDPGVHAEPFQRVLHSERIHDGREHAHVVRRDAVHARSGEARPAEQIAGAEDHRDLGASLIQFVDFTGDAPDHLGVYAELGVPHQGLAAQLQQNSAVT